MAAARVRSATWSAGSAQQNRPAYQNNNECGDTLGQQLARHRSRWLVCSEVLGRQVQLVGGESCANRESGGNCGGRRNGKEPCGAGRNRDKNDRPAQPESDTQHDRASRYHLVPTVWAQPVLAVAGL